MLKAVAYLSSLRPDVRTALTQQTGVETVIVEKSDEQKLAAALPGAEILITSNRIYSENVGRIVRERGRALKWIQFTTAGFDNAINAGLSKGLVITNCGGVRSHSVAEQTFYLLLALIRQARAIEAANLRHDWIRDSISPSLHNLAGRHMLIAGMGPLGQALTRRALAFDMTVSGVSRTLEPPPGVTKVWPRAQFAEACREADIVVLATALDDDTTKIINRDSLAAMRKGAYFINVARGAMVDEAALVDALNSGHLGGAGLDVTDVEPTPKDTPLWNLPNVVLSPHVAGAGDPSEAGSGRVITQNFATYLAGKPFARATRT